MRMNDLWTDDRARWLAAAGLTAVIVGYFGAWLSHPTAGLTLIGLDISEWTKFLPQMQSGELPNRDWFYVPPVAVGWLMLLLTADAAPRRWQTWVWRLAAVAVAALALPSIDAIRFEDQSQWVPRLLMVGSVAAGVVAVPLLARFVSASLFWRGWVVLAAVIGVVLPTWAALAVQPVIADWLGVQMGIGWGVWLNAIGFVGVVGAAVFKKATFRFLPGQ